jgi:hypothetical protein
MLITVIFTTACWLAAAYWGPQTDPAVLVSFYRKVRPAGPGWRRVRELAGITDAEAAEASRDQNIPTALLGWASGCVTIWASLFTAGNFLYGRLGLAAVLLGVTVVSGWVLTRVVNQLWRQPGVTEPQTVEAAAT